MSMPAAAGLIEEDVKELGSTLFADQDAAKLFQIGPL
jgi:hypothetical protein